MGYNDEVLDVKFLGKDDSHIVVATNSCQLKVFELLTNSCQILFGHTGESPAGGSTSSVLEPVCVRGLAANFTSSRNHQFFFNIVCKFEFLK